MEKLNNRLTILDQFLVHPYLGKSFQKLKPADLEVVKAWVGSTLALDGNQLQLSSVRMFMDRDNRPKNWTRIIELASCISTRVKTTEDRI